MRNTTQLAIAKAPELGQIIRIRGLFCRIVRIRPFGTIDVESLDGSRAFRVSGLAWDDGEGDDDGAYEC